MNTQKKFQIFFSALLVLALLAGAVPAQMAYAYGPTTWYVNSGGAASPTCNGTTNATFAAAQAAHTTPACAFSNLDDALYAAGTGDMIYLGNTLGGGAEWSITTTETSYRIDKGVQIIVGDHIRLWSNSAVNSFFEVSANGVRISAESRDGGSYIYAVNIGQTGIVVDAGVSNFIVDGLNFYGSSSGETGIDFKGAITDLQIVNNLFKYFNSTGGTALKFAAVPDGVVDIKGNYFGYTTDGNVKLPAANSLDLKYNSWTERNTPSTADTNALKGADASHTTYLLPKFTHKMALAGGRTGLAVTYGDTLTVTVGADVKELTGAQFNFTFDPDVLQFTAVDTTDSDFAAAGLSGLVDISAANTGTVSFHGLSKGGDAPGSVALDDENAVFFKAVFSIKPVSSRTFTNLSISTVGAGFTMDPGYGPSNSIIFTGLNNSLEQEVLAGKGNVSGTVSMQGRIARDGVAVKLWQAATEKAATASIDKISGNYTFTDVVNGSYQITFVKKGYLDLKLDLNKTDYFVSGGTVASLELKGGDANDDNTITVEDGTLIGADYGTAGRDAVLDQETGATAFTDINSDGTVNIFDLALMGGNYDLTSTPTDNTNVYYTWTPQ